MFCQKCGTENLEDASFCVSCGEQLKKVDVSTSEPVVDLEKKNDFIEITNPSPVQSPNPVQNQRIIQNQNEFQSNNNTNVQQVKSPLVWSILVTVFGLFSCCCFNPFSLFIGIAAIIFSTQVDDKQRRGDIEGAKSSAKTAAILNWVGLGIMIFILIIYIVLFVLGVVSTDSYSNL